MATKSYRYVGTHAHEFSIGDTRVQVEPGGFVDLSTDDLKDNASIHEDGLLLDVTPTNEGKEAKK